MSEYTITVTVREVDGGVHVQQHSEIGEGNGMAATVASALSLAMARHVIRLKKCIAEAQEDLIGKADKTIH